MLQYICANNEIYYRELTVLGSYSPAPVDLQDSLNLLRSGQVKVEGLSTIYELDNIQNENTNKNVVILEVTYLLPYHKLINGFKDYTKVFTG